MPRDPSAYVYDVLRASHLIRRFVEHKTFEDYVADELLRSAVERPFEIIGEALNRLGKRDVAALDRIREHRRIIDFRNLLIHGYGEIDDAVVWSVVSEKLPALIEDVQMLWASLERKDSP